MRNEAMERNVKVGCEPVDEEIDNATSRARARDKTRDIVSRTTIRCIVSLFRFLFLSFSLGMLH